MNNQKHILLLNSFAFFVARKNRNNNEWSLEYMIEWSVERMVQSSITGKFFRAAVRCMNKIAMMRCEYYKIHGLGHAPKVKYDSIDILCNSSRRNMTFTFIHFSNTVDDYTFVLSKFMWNVRTLHLSHISHEWIFLTVCFQASCSAR